MPDVPLDFSWEVPESGYRWVQTHTVDQAQDERWDYLVATRPAGKALSRVLRYQPLIKYSGLFREFAALEPDYNAVRAFANRFGLLGRPLTKHVFLHEGQKANEGRVVVGEHIDAWVNEILAMRLAVSLWEGARMNDTERLGRMIFWEADGSGVRIDTHPHLQPHELPERPFLQEAAWIAGTHLGDDVLARFVPGELTRPALDRAQHHVNERLRGRASPRLLWDPQGDRLGLYIVPEGLIGALWLQFARAIERESTFRQCEECGTWFELAPDTARSDKRYCSTPCRTKAYRKRQVEAARLHGEGRSIEEIARELNSEPDTVRGWIERQQQASAAAGRRAPD